MFSDYDAEDDKEVDSEDYDGDDSLKRQQGTSGQSQFIVKKKPSMKY